MKRERLLEGLKQFVVAFFTFFLVVSFIITCSFLLFLKDFELPLEMIPHAAKITFVNIILFALIFVGFDIIRRKLTIERPVNQISDALDQIMQGDFDVRLKPSGKYSGFAEIMKNINHMTEELGSVETLRTDFVSNVSHEMKTPLAVMQNYSTLLQSPDLTEAERMDYAKAISHECRKLADLMTNILKLNRLENQQIYPNVEVYDLGEQLCQCLLQFEQIWDKKRLDIVIDIAEDVRIKADSELLWLVWNNLFSNAFKFTDHGTISLKLETTDTHAIVTISDTGCGMSPEVGKHIFEKFYQGDTSHATAGNGLGLALVKRIIDIVDGEISVSSALGAGSTFTIRLRRCSDGEA